MKISAAERLVMEALWRSRQPLTADQIVLAVVKRQAWTSATVKTLINRLLGKNAISAERDGRRYLYSPLLRRDDYVFAESKGLLDRLFDGRLAPLVSHFSERKQLSKRDVAELKKLLEELDDDH